MVARDSLPRKARSGVGRRPAARACAGLLFAASSLHCQRELGPELLAVDAVLPAEAQFGDSVQVIGDGFGLGSPATVTLRGDVFRAGREPEPVEFSFRAQTESQRELGLELTRDAEAAFCGEPEHASHATFRGDVEVAIAARAPGAPPATGRLHGVVVELYPAVKTQGTEHRLGSLGREVLEFLGIDVTAARAGGLEVIHVASGSRAARADVRPGDHLVSAGGLTVRTPSDLVPNAARELEVGVVRAGVEQSLWLDVDGFVPRPPASIGWAALAIFAAALWFVGSASPLAGWIGWVAQNWVDQQRARFRAKLRGPGAGLRGPEWPSLLELWGGASGVLVWLGAAAALSASLLRRAPVDVSLGLLVAMFISAALLGALAFVGAGEGQRPWSLRRASGAALAQWLMTLPAWLALLATSIESGLDLDDVARAQGALPWEWNAFRNPGLFIACGGLLLSALPRAGKATFKLAHARPPRLSWRVDGDGWFDRLYLCATCAMASHAFLGGDALPFGLGAGAGPLGVAAAATWVVAKYTLLVLGVSLLRGLCLGVTPTEWSQLALRYCLPASLLGLALTQVWRSARGMSPLMSWVELGFGPACVAATLLAVLAVTWRAHALSRDPGPPSLSPWL